MISITAPEPATAMMSSSLTGAFRTVVDRKCARHFLKYVRPSYEGEYLPVNQHAKRHMLSSGCSLLNFSR